MMPHVLYLRYVLVHKWFVFVACYQIRAPLWNAIIHDWSKFRPREWFPYVDYFYRRGGAYSPGCDDAFDMAWLFHQHANPHHHQHWLLRQDDGQVKALPMPERYIREMMADWIGASRAQGHGDDVQGWYERNKEKMVLHPATRKRLEDLLRRRQRFDAPWRIGKVL